MSEEEKPVLTEEEIKKLVEKPYDVGYLDQKEREKIKNTVAQLDEEIKSVKALKSFIDPGILVCPHLILYAHPTEYQLNVTLKAFESEDWRDGGKFVHVQLTVPQIDRLNRLLPEALKAARLHRDLNRLKKILSEKTSRRRY